VGRENSEVGRTNYRFLQGGTADAAENADGIGFMRGEGIFYIDVSVKQMLN
jgi:hypothetical protein